MSAAVELGSRMLETILVDCPDANVCSGSQQTFSDAEADSLRSASYDASAMQTRCAIPPLSSCG
jgi:hypothetical protein